MTDRRYDAIVAGARCAGSPAAMLLARKGYRVLLPDRARFPSGTVSTHLVHAPGTAALGRWGLLGRRAATGCPPVTTCSFDLGPLALSGTPRPAGDAAADAALAPGSSYGGRAGRPAGDGRKSRPRTKIQRTDVIR